MVWCVVYYDGQTKKISGTTVLELQSAVITAYPNLQHVTHYIQVWDNDVHAYIDLDRDVAEDGTKLQVVVRCEYN